MHGTMNIKGSQIFQKSKLRAEDPQCWS